MTEYRVNFTDKSKTPITIGESNIDNGSTDLSLPGRKKLEYGASMNANFLHLVENFACPEDPTAPGNPDLEKASFQDNTLKKLLSAPVEGQMWYNITQETLFVWTQDAWVAIAMSGDIAANWGVISNGNQLPLPVNQHGYTFSYEECSWIVSPFVLDGAFRYVQCYTDETSRVTMTYLPEDPTLPEVSGCVNYMIVGIKGNKNLGTLLPVPPVIPRPTPTPTPTPSLTSSPAPSPTSSVTPTPGVSATSTPEPTPSPTSQPTLTPTPSPINYIASISASPAGMVAPGQEVCYTVTLNYPAPASGYTFQFIRSGDAANICASTAGETSGPIIENTPMTIPPGQNTLVICRTVPGAAIPPPTPTAAPQYACKVVHPDNNTWGATYWHGFMCATNNGGALDYFTNSSSGNGNYYPCTQWTACNNATSYSSTQTIANDPVRGNRRYYNATPAAHLVLAVQIPGIATSENVDIYLFGTSAQTTTRNVTIGNRSFTITLNINPVLVSESGANKTWRLDSNYVVTDNQTGVVTNYCNI